MLEKNDFLQIFLGKPFGKNNNPTELTLYFVKKNSTLVKK